MDLEIETLKGVKIPREIIAQSELVCDICKKQINILKIGIYVSDVNIADKKRTDMNVDVIFCSKCNPEKIRYPHLGINEINFTVFLESYNNSTLVKEVQTNHISKDNEGIVWMPLNSWNKLTDETYKPTSAAYVSEKLIYKGLPLNKIIQSDGKLNIDYVIKNY